ncbi:MAG TPA: DUF2031 domain-containing protein [Candidatus Rothia avistercoris]|uniref:DUF2031 domain-containing protein n=1 Tax=Candidatus Rothia avistercoris TaxID=2840479 RepID=A0A9D2UE77_9MICC|nr:DUF2031 domain-containing protein [Candidatus Rothia avistercoris]
MGNRITPLSEKQEKRSASSTIAGYLYQFERSVIELLQLDRPEDVIRVEGIEDIDIWSSTETVVQIKYYSAKKFSLPIIREAVYELLLSFADRPLRNYILYIHCGEGGEIPEKLTLDKIKECLTYQVGNNKGKRIDEDSPFDDSTLKGFAENNFRIYSGPTLDDQMNITISELAKSLECDREEAKILHHGRAVQYIHQIAVRKKDEDRIISKEDFIKHLKIREQLYNRWHKQLLGDKRFHGEIAKKLKKAKYNDKSKSRGISLEVNEDNVGSVKQLAIELAGDLDVSKARTRKAKPWTLILRGDKQLIKMVKTGLLEKKYYFNDGYESINFSHDYFDASPIVNTKRTDVVSKRSFYIRVVGEGAIKPVCSMLCKLDCLILLDSNETWYREISSSIPTEINAIKIEDLNSLLREVAL